jgi:hypothetical protein
MDPQELYEAVRDFIIHEHGTNIPNEADDALADACRSICEHQDKLNRCNSCGHDWTA